jgi:beta-lactamase regulating signal transducer with metallopeptidase domain
MCYCYHWLVAQRKSSGLRPHGRRFDSCQADMGIGVSLILIAAGAILTWAVDATVSGLEISTVGVILMVVGIVGLLISLIILGSDRRSDPDRLNL